MTQKFKTLKVANSYTCTLSLINLFNCTLKQAVFNFQDCENLVLLGDGYCDDLTNTAE